VSDAAVFALVAERAGLEMLRGGMDRTLRSFVGRRSVELGLSAERYLGKLSEPDSPELEALLNAITVGYTWFFRDAGQLEAVSALVTGELAVRRPLRAWVPGCSTGEDAYSIAILATLAGADLQILATDLNSRALALARSGGYRGFSLRDLKPSAARYFTRRPDGSTQLSPEIVQRVRFERHNLVERPPSTHGGGGWDIIVCRNVLIYFRREVALRVLDGLARALAPGGYLVLGASEVVIDVPPGLEARYVASRLVFRRAPLAGGPSVHPPPPSDWLLSSPAPPSSTGLLSALPFAAAASEATRVPHATEPGPGDLADGHALLDRGDVARACAAYRRVLVLNPTRADARLYAGVSAYLAGDIGGALPDLRAALLLDEGLWPAAFYLALCHESSGHPEEALRAYQHVVRLDERDRDRRRSVGQLFDAWRGDLTELARRRAAAVRPGTSAA